MSANASPIKTLLASSFLGWLLASAVLFLFFNHQVAQSHHPMAYQIGAIGLMFIAYAFAPALLGAALWGSVWLRHAAERGLKSKWTYLFAGLVRGAAVGAMSCAIMLGPFGPAWWGFALIGIPYSAAIGTLTGIFVWLDRRPDRDAANPATAAP